MTDPVELTTLPVALKEVAAGISDIDLARGRQALRDKYEAMGFFLPEPRESSRPLASNIESIDKWSKQELAVLRFQSAIVKGEIDTYVRDPESGALIELDPGDWGRAAYCEQIIRGGIIRASACEGIERYRGQTPLIKKDSVRRWLAAERRRRPVADARSCRSWLLGAMRASPDQKIKAKREWQIEATRLFGVTVRAFNRAWRSAIEASGSSWNRPGAPHKSSQ